MRSRAGSTEVHRKLTGSAQEPEHSAGHTDGMANAAPPEARLLVVDDEPNIVELLEASLRFHGFDVTTCGDGTSALALAKSLRPDLMVADVMMPGLNGFELVRSLRADGYQFPVLFLTAKDAVEDRVTGLTIGGDDYIVKPFSPRELASRVSAVLARGRS